MTESVVIKSAVCYSLGLRAQEATSYVRVISPLRSSNVKIINGILPDNSIDTDLVREGDIVIVQRDFPRNFENFCSLVDKCRSYNKKLIFDIDDLLFELPQYHHDRQRHHFTPYLLPIYYAIQEADLVTVPTHALKEYVSCINENTIVLPNYLDDQLWKAKDLKRGGNEKIVIGYMGTATHYSDLESISLILMKLLDDFEDRVQLRIWGFDPPPDLCQHPSVSYNSLFYVSYPAFAKWFREVSLDIAIAPLNDHIFNKCKSNLKFLEYSINGISGVYSDIEAYNSVVVNGHNGLLARDPDDWQAALRRLIEDDGLRTQVAAHARATAERAWTWSANAAQWRSSIMQGLSAARREDKSRLVIRSIAKQNLSLMHSIKEESFRALDKIEACQARALQPHHQETHGEPNTEERIPTYNSSSRENNGMEYAMNSKTRSSQLRLRCYDATTETGHFDPCWLDVIQYTPAWMCRSERLMMFTLAFSLRPQHYLEIGTFQGGSALLVCSALDALESDGKMYLVDPNPKIAPEYWDKLKHRAKLYKGYSPDILHIAASEAGKFDLVLIDGDHSYQGVMRDAEGVLPYTESGGYIIFHDSFCEEVCRAIDDFVDQHSERVVDLGILTREFTPQMIDNKLIRWGGLRILYIVE